jgi:hypothetical protein
MTVEKKSQLKHEAVIDPNKYQQFLAHKCNPAETGVETTDVSDKYTFSYTPTGVGTVIKISCGLCKKSEDITDYKSW